MGGLLGFLFIYVLGGLTFIPLLIAAVLMHAYLTFPIHDDTAYRDHKVESIIQPGDDVDAIKRVQQTLGEKYQPRDGHESEVFAGWFAVSREYTAGGLNGKPPERVTPIGSTTVSAPSPSVYQSMYRSIFERKPSNSPIENKSNGKPPKRGNNVFYVVLRHGHLMLFDDDEQIEVRHVVSLAHHKVSIYSGGDETPEGELFIKRNSICLSRRTDAGELTPDGKASKPFFFFSESCSEKEDFYFALLRNQERKLEAAYNPPVPLHYDVKDIITLVQKLHSSEEQLQTRWMNAVIGRIFLALYKTSEVEDFIRAKITKKISRVKTPSFLSKISLRNVDMGEAAPVFTNPRLKDLTVDGELVVEADMRYSGNFRLEVATTARIELGSRFKAREVNLLLAVVLKRIEGHVMIRIKPPPSNRIWFTFSAMPKIDMTIEPIISARQITYTLILRQIENRIKEVVAESLVSPNWDDVPFYNTEHKVWRGGTWAEGTSTHQPLDPETAAAQDGDVDEVGHLEAENDEAILDLPPVEKSITAPLIDPAIPSTAYARKGAKSAINLAHSKSSASSTSVETRSSAPEKPRALRSGSFASASSPIVSTDVTHADAFKSSTPPEHSHAMAAISALSQTASPISTPIGSPSVPSRIEKLGSLSSISSRESANSEGEKDIQGELTPQASLNYTDIFLNSDPSSYLPSPASMSNASLKPEAPSIRSFGSLGRDPRRENSSSSSGKSTTSENKRLSLAAVSNAAATAKKWGWNALQRHAEQKPEGVTEDVPSRPLVMGRGQPLPPPGVPLPRPSKTNPIAVPKRKPIAPPSLPARRKDSADLNSSTSHLPQHIPPPLPKRRSREEELGQEEPVDDGLLVVAAPSADSEPTTPMSEHTPSYLPPWVDDVDENEEEIGPTSRPVPKPKPEPIPPRLPKRRPPHRVMSTSPEEDSHKLPSWMAAQEEEARAKSAFVDEDSGL
ncbi:hypothetical protein BDZ45DRAFT_680327 [Acephala macrosclerotiorum]|nr:hypothetical protein BDZ45DRAFT_680327 [Acephala macrosclerotiorum]